MLASHGFKEGFQLLYTSKGASIRRRRFWHTRMGQYSPMAAKCSVGVVPNMGIMRVAPVESANVRVVLLKLYAFDGS